MSSDNNFDRHSFDLFQRCGDAAHRVFSLQFVVCSGWVDNLVYHILRIYARGAAAPPRSAVRDWAIRSSIKDSLQFVVFSF